ncbi:MAG: hypothetical protein AAF804_12455 [Bacteroidota bacterium]
MNFSTNHFTRITVIALLGLVLTLSACLTSIYPYYFEEDLIEADWLLGDWQGIPDTIQRVNDRPLAIKPSYWGFYAKDSNDQISYRLRHSGSGESDTVEFIAKPFQLQGQTYLDLKAHDFPMESGLAAMTLVTAHLLVKVEQREAGLSLSTFNSTWLAEQVESGSYRIKHEIPEDGLVLLTASTEDLQTMIKHYQGDAAAFEELDFIRRFP